MSSLQAEFGFPRLTAIGSGKGGTGKTFVAITLAHALARHGQKVLLCDADLGLSNTSLQLGLDTGGDLAGVLSGNISLDQAIAPVFGGVAIKGGFDLLGAAAGSGALANMGEMGAGQLLTSLRFSGDYTHILLDLGAGVDTMVMTFAAGADDNLLVMTPDPSALTDAYAFTKLLAQRAPGRVPSVLVNMTAGGNEAQRTADALCTVATRFLNITPHFMGSVPRDPYALTAIRRQTSLLEAYPQSPAAKAMNDIALKICGISPDHMTARFA